MAMVILNSSITFGNFSDNNVDIIKSLNNIIDNNDSTCGNWKNKDSSTSYIQFSVSSIPTDATHIVLKTFVGNPSYSNDMTIYASVDNSDYVKIGSTGQLFSDEVSEIALSEDITSYKYFRIYSSFASIDTSIGLYYLKFCQHIREDNPKTSLTLHKSLIDEIPEDSGYNNTNEIKL